VLIALRPLGTALFVFACFISSQRPKPQDHETALVSAPPANVNVIVDSSPSDAEIGVWLAR
jgi:hypothetical protein